ANPNASNTAHTVSMGITPLIMAVMNKDAESVRLLIDNGANVNQQSADGDTALKWAAAEGNLPIVEMLLDRGANVNCRDWFGMTPLMEAVSPLAKDSAGRADVVKLL